MGLTIRVGTAGASRCPWNGCRVSTSCSNGMPIPIRAWKKRCIRFRYYASLWASTWEEGLILDEKQRRAANATEAGVKGVRLNALFRQEAEHVFRGPVNQWPEMVEPRADPLEQPGVLSLVRLFPANALPHHHTLAGLCHIVREAHEHLFFQVIVTACNRKRRARNPWAFSAHINCN